MSHFHYPKFSSKAYLKTSNQIGVFLHIDKVEFPFSIRFNLNKSLIYLTFKCIMIIQSIPPDLGSIFVSWGRGGGGGQGIQVLKLSIKDSWLKSRVVVLQLSILIALYTIIYWNSDAGIFNSRNSPSTSTCIDMCFPLWPNCTGQWWVERAGLGVGSRHRLSSVVI